MKKQTTGPAVLVVSFGTSYRDSCEKTIGGIEDAMQKAFPQYEVRRAFTSQMILNKLRERDHLFLDNGREALHRAAADGIQTLIVQPTFLMDGSEYRDFLEEVHALAPQFRQIVVGTPLLTSEADYDAVIAAITAETQCYDDGKTAMVFMGHGSQAEANQIYTTLQNKVIAAGYPHVYIGTVEADPALEHVVQALEGKGYTKVVLEPLMVVAGDHANHDMAGNGENSWKTILTNAGYAVTCIIRGLGELESIQKIYISHAKAAAAQLKNG